MIKSVKHDNTYRSLQENWIWSPSPPLLTTTVIPHVHEEFKIMVTLELVI